MKTAVYTLTAEGRRLGESIAAAFQGECVLFTKTDYQKEFTSFVRGRFRQFQLHIFVMAAGIAVRTIGPLLESKWTDPAVIVIDDQGRFVISLVSGHMGGANEYTRKLAAALEATPVVTTATDGGEKIAFDEAARKNNLYIENKYMVKTISMAVLQDESIALHTVYPVLNKPAYISDAKTASWHVWISNEKDIPFFGREPLILRPRNLILGVGCKKNTDMAHMESCFLDFMARCKKSVYSLDTIVSIDLKKEENAIRYLAEKYHVSFQTLSVAYLQAKGADEEGSFSQFVKQTTGIGSVAESCVRHIREDVTLLAPKTVYPGITFALGEIKTEINLE